MTSSGKATVTQLCELFEVSRSGYYSARDRAARQQQTGGTVIRLPRPRRGVPADQLVPAIKDIIDAHPAWGVRKVWATLRRDGICVGRRRVHEVMRAKGWVLHSWPHRAQVTRGHVVTPEPNRRFATDLTTVYTRRDSTVAITLTVDCGCRSVLDVAAHKSQESQVVLGTVERSLQTAFGTPAAVPDGLELRTDHGPQYTGGDAVVLTERWHLDHTFAPVGRPTGNAVAERTIQTMKVESIWLQDWEDADEVHAALQRWRWSFNHERPHQALDWQTPAERRASRLGATTAAAA